MRRIRVVGGVLVGITLSACGGQWQRQDALNQVAPEQQVQVWRGGSDEIWHAVRIDSQFLSGIPYHRPRTCTECRLAVPRGEIDSLRVGNLARGFRNSMLLALGIMIAFAWTFRGLGGD